MSRFSRLNSKRRALAAWLFVVVVLASAVGVWGMTLAGVVSIHPRAEVAAPEPRFGAEESFITAFDDSALAPPTCIYTQSNQGIPIILSAKTGSVLSGTQSANCTK